MNSLAKDSSIGDIYVQEETREVYVKRTNHVWEKTDTLTKEMYEVLKLMMKYGALHDDV